MNDQVNYAKIQRIQDNLEALVIGQFGTGFVTDAMLYESGVKATVVEHTSQLAEKANQYDTFMTLLSDVSNLSAGKRCTVLGFYAKNDCSVSDWYIAATTGSETWVDSGYGFYANTSMEIQLNISLKAVYVGKTIETKQFGCKSNGTNDDSKLLILLLTSSKLDSLFISSGTHVINITAGTSHSLRYFIDTVNVTKVYGNKGKSIIKLGSGNCDERVYKGFHSLFNYHADDLDIVWNGVTLDYNNTNSPVYQTSGQFIGVENNIGQLAISGSGRSLTITNCTFKDCSGTNVISFTPRTTNTGNAVVDISYNKFQNIGNKAKYVDGSNNTLDAYHDHSTIGVHNVSTSGYNYTLTSYVHHNEFIGADTNAYNTFECSANVQYFYENTVRNYVIGCLVEPSHKNIISRVYNNNLINVQQGISVWTQNVYTTEPNEISYKMLEIKGNYILVDPLTFRSKPTYYEHITDTDGYYMHFYNTIRFSGVIYRNIDMLSICDNTLEFTYETGATASKISSPVASAYNSYHSGEAIGFWQMFDGTTIGQFTAIPFMTHLQIKGNKFKNIYRCPILFQTYPRIDYVDICDNEFYNCLIDTTFYGTKEVCKIAFAGNGASSPYKTISGISAYLKSFNFQNNRVIDTVSDNMLAINIDNTSFSVTGSMLNFKGNITNNTPSTYMFNLQGVATSIGTISSDTTSHN